MRLMLLLALPSALCPLPALSAPVPAAKSGGPPMVMYTAPVGKLIESAKAIAKAAAGEQVAGAVDQAIQGKFGQAGLDGLDLTKPLAAYVYFPDKVPTDVEEWKATYGVVIVPVTSVEKFKAMVERGYGDTAPKFKPVAGDDGLFEITGPDGTSNIQVLARFADGSLYVGINAPKEALAAGKLVSAATFADAKVPALLTVRSFTDRMPEAWRKNPLAAAEEQFEKMKEQLGGIGMSEAILVGYMKMLKGMTARWADADEGGYRLRFDEAAGEVAFDTYIKPKAGGKLAAELTDRKPAMNQFGSLVTAEVAAGVTLSIPFTPEFRELLLPLVAEGEKNVNNAPEEARPLVKELLAGAARTIKGDSLDVAWAVTPGKDGKYVAAGGLTFAGADKLEPLVKDAVKNSKDEKAIKAFKFDVATAGGVNLHEIVPPEENEPAAFKKIAEACGGRAITVAFGPQGVYAGFGAGGRAAVEALLAAKPAAAKPFDVIVNPKRLGALVAAVEADAGDIAKAVLGDADKPMSAMYGTASVADGELRYTFGVNLNLVAKPFAMIGARAR